MSFVLRASSEILKMHVRAYIALLFSYFIMQIMQYLFTCHQFMVISSCLFVIPPLGPTENNIAEQSTVIKLLSNFNAAYNVM